MKSPQASASHWHTGTCAHRLATAVLGLGLLASGCATAQMALVKPVTWGFLGIDYALLTPGETANGQAGLRYFNPAAQWCRYDKILIEPVTFWGDEAGKVAPSDQQALSTYFNGEGES